MNDLNKAILILNILGLAFIFYGVQTVAKFDHHFHSGITVQVQVDNPDSIQADVQARAFPTELAITPNIR